MFLGYIVIDKKMPKMKLIASVILKFLFLKTILKNSIRFVKGNYLLAYHNLFNDTVINQNKNYKSIPIIIISFNQLFYLKKLIDFLKKAKYENIVIIDNNSTFEPLLDYFNEIESTVTLHKLKDNIGHLVFWKTKELFKKYSKGYYVITDADINPIKDCPDDFLLYFKKNLDKDFKITKVGFSLKIDDIPNTNSNKEKILKWESQFWINQTKDENFIAKIDTTFAIYRPNFSHNSFFLNGSRTSYPYQARHGGWYVDRNNLTEEQLYYYSNCNKSSSWRVDDKGNLLNNYYKKVL